MKVFETIGLQTLLDVPHERPVVFTQSIKDLAGEVVVGNRRTQSRQLINGGLGILKIVMNSSGATTKMLQGFGEVSNLDFGSRGVDASQRRPRIKGYCPVDNIWQHCFREGEINPSKSILITIIPLPVGRIVFAIDELWGSRERAVNVSHHAMAPKERSNLSMPQKIVGRGELDGHQRIGGRDREDTDRELESVEAEVDETKDESVAIMQKKERIRDKRKKVEEDNRIDSLEYFDALIP
ncbi:unnamed protein product [Linum trigynum]|uniref:Uncharacterized protein n=1 Tax=Linum trigynum TaxID=586398 RepID=A0AAV2EX70_9ROSI